MGELIVLKLRNFTVGYDEIVDGRRYRKIELVLAQTKKQAIRNVQENHRLENKKTSNYLCSKREGKKE